MALDGTILLPEDLEKMQAAIAKLRSDANARSVFLLDRNGQHFASSGDTQGLDITALSSLAAGNVAATDSLAKLLGEQEFSVLFHEGEKDNLHISLIGPKGILVVIFDERSSLGLVRLRVRKAAVEIAKILEAMHSKKAPGSGSDEGGPDPFLGEITDEDINNLFGI